MVSLASCRTFSRFNYISIFCVHGPLLPVRAKSYYITTPIYYVNSVPHIGHLYTTTLADVSCRWQRLKLGHSQYTEGKLVTGTDEHGLKVKQAARLNNMDTLDFCNEVSGRFRNLITTFGMNAFDFIRTTEPRHIKAVQHFWQRVKDNGFIYKGTYRGWYSVPDEAFVPEHLIVLKNDGAEGQTRRVSKESGHTLQWMEEENYKFKLSLFGDQIRDWVLFNEKSVHPAKFRNQVLKELEEPLEDLSISRNKNKVPWGIPVPGDESHRVYVWFDALVNYLTATGYPDTNQAKFTDMWPADVHIVGQDIMRFHTIYWPAFLIAAGLQLPKQVVVHSHWMYDNAKMSKTKGNVVDPFDIASTVSAEGLRYFLLRQGVIGEDCNFSEWLLHNVLNSDLANDLGNCLHRLKSKKLNPSETYPSCDAAMVCKDTTENRQYTAGDDVKSLVLNTQNLPHKLEPHFNNFEFYKALGEIIGIIQAVNIVLTRYKLWELNRDDTKQSEFIDTILYCCCEAIRVCSILLQPFIPKLSETSLDKLGVPQESRRWENAIKSFSVLKGENDEMVGRPFGGNTKPLFQRLPKHPSKTVNQKTKS